MESLDEIVRSLPLSGAPQDSPSGPGTAAFNAAATTTTTIELHVGDADPGDVHEARVLQEAIAAYESAAAPHRGSGDQRGPPPRLACDVTVHAARDHNLVVDMRDTGELHELLCRFVAEGEGAGDARGSAPAQIAMPEAFGGFQDCPDF